MKTCVIDVGGGLRGIFGAGVFDRCLDLGVSFDCCIGVSAGSANISSFLAGQKGRNTPFYLDYPFRRQYMSLWNWITKGSYLDLDYVYKTLSEPGGENPLDYEAMFANPAEMIAVSSDAVRGGPVYFTKEDIRPRNHQVFCASCCVPIFCRPYSFRGRLYCDGALTDPVPVQKALDLGCGRIVLILTKPRDMLRDPADDEKHARMLERKYPAEAADLRNRARRYNEGVRLAEELEAAGRLLILAPEAGLPQLKTLGRDRAVLAQMYDSGNSAASAVPGFLAKTAD